MQSLNEHLQHVLFLNRAASSWCFKESRAAVLFQGISNMSQPANSTAFIMPAMGQNVRQKNKRKSCGKCKCRGQHKPRSWLKKMIFFLRLSHPYRCTREMVVCHHQCNQTPLNHCAPLTAVTLLYLYEVNMFMSFRQTCIYWESVFMLSSAERQPSVALCLTC